MGGVEHDRCKGVTVGLRLFVGAYKENLTMKLSVTKGGALDFSVLGARKDAVAGIDSEYEQVGLKFGAGARDRMV